MCMHLFLLKFVPHDTQPENFRVDLKNVFLKITCSGMKAVMRW